MEGEKTPSSTAERLLIASPRSGDRVEVWEVERRIDAKITSRVLQLRVHRQGDCRALDLPTGLEQLWKSLA